MGRITTSEREKVENIVKGRGHNVTYVPPIAVILILIIMGLVAYLIAGFLLKLQPGLIMPPFMFGA